MVTARVLMRRILNFEFRLDVLNRLRWKLATIFFRCVGNSNSDEYVYILITTKKI